MYPLGTLTVMPRLLRPSRGPLLVPSPCVSKPLMPGSNLKAFTGLECRVAIELSGMGHFRVVGSEAQRVSG